MSFGLALTLIITPVGLIAVLALGSSALTTWMTAETKKKEDQK